MPQSLTRTTVSEDFANTLLPMLRCPACRSGRRLRIEPGRIDDSLPAPCRDEHLLCGDCGARYSITDDYIPVLVTSEVLSVYRTANCEAGAASALGANIAIYDTFSDDYHECTRRDPAIGQRMTSGTRRLLAAAGQDKPKGDQKTRLVHLDFGCGPGHVLEWLRDFNFLQIGLDVSLHNLRNARKSTGCLAVCGDACNLPLADKSADLVTESSVLHHIQNWEAAVQEALRVCSGRVGIVLDSEPPREQLAWSPLAVAVLNMRFPFYKMLSYLNREKYVFRNMKKAKLNLLAEIHHQPGTGLDVDLLTQLFQRSGFAIDVIRSPTPELESKAHPSLKGVVMSVLSARNPWNPRYGAFTAVAQPSQPLAS